jgi:hypothetical protein
MATILALNVIHGFRRDLVLLLHAHHLVRATLLVRPGVWVV